MVYRASFKPIKLFATSSSKHLLRSLSIEKGSFVCSPFSDGEIYLKVMDEVNDKNIWVLANTCAPAENLLELFFLLDALTRMGARINLIVNYFGYARQDKPKHGESSSGELIAKCLQALHLEKVYIVHMHSQRLRHALTYENLIPLELFAKVAASFDAVVAPDRGAEVFAKQIAEHIGKPVILIEKQRPRQEKVKILSVQGEVKNLRLLIVDDMISTGNTILAGSQLLYAKGAKYIEVMATHGLFAQGALKKLEKSKIGKITVTNSLPQEQHSPKLRVLNLSPLVKDLIDSQS